jgi:hypothetical protein
MSPRSIAAIALVSVLAGSGVRAAEGEGGRASVPPGTSQDGSKPSEGAIVGGSVQTQRPEDPPARNREARRCNQLQGTLRQQCIDDARKAQQSGQQSSSPPAPTAPR